MITHTTHTPLQELRPIPGYAEYHAGNDGHIYSSTGWRGQVIRQLVEIHDTDGYYKVRLSIEGKRINRKVHRLVLVAFYGPPDTPHLETCHIDGDKRNNRPSNLKWGSRKENADDRARHGRTSNGYKHSQAIKEGLCNRK